MVSETAIISWCINVKRDDNLRIIGNELVSGRAQYLHKHTAENPERPQSQ